MTDFFFPVLKLFYWIFLGSLRVLKVFLPILDFRRWTLGRLCPKAGRIEPRHSNCLFLSEREFGSLEGIKKKKKTTTTLYEGFHQRKTKSFQLAFPGFQTVAFCFLRLAKRNLRNKQKKQFSFSISLKIDKNSPKNSMKCGEDNLQ